MAEKERVSGDIEMEARQQPQEPVLPVHNPAAEKPAPQQAGLHPAVYVAYVRS
jgi:hypothetical protein